MKKTLIAAALTLALPAAAIADDTTAAPSAKSLAKQACKQERKQSKAAYKLTYKSVGIAVCVKVRAASAGAAVENAAQWCKAQRETLGKDAFRMQYAPTGHPNGANAFGKCVSQRAKSETSEQTEDRVSAAATCRTELKASETDFAAAWGAGRNAFGKCVKAGAKKLAAERKAAEQTGTQS